jgi:predicted SprT family Zn-dependent metalloprotease
MAEPLSKNARVGVVTQKYFCTCGGEVKMRQVFNNGKLRNIAECDKCRRQGRKPSDFKA